MNGLLEPGGPLMLIAVFLWLWTMVCFAVSICGGWLKLARYYPAGEDVVRKRWRMQKGRMRLMTGYGGCLNFGATDKGLALSILFLFRPGHPRLHIPWEDIAMERDKPLVMMKPGIKLSFEKAPGIPLIIREGLAREINMAAGGRWDELFESRA